ncbi:superoxide dismutase, Ni [Candidatus Saccharibacteria bacterium]|nr:MAG: superoxide dismutase, Ni [Candidatus Saccharibacteria bacterium]
MKRFHIKPAYAHCDLPCGVYDPAQARIEAASVKAMMEKYETLDEHNKLRAVILIEQRAELVKQHLMVLWADYFKPAHLKDYPDLHEKFWYAIKQASACKHHRDPAEVQTLLEMIDGIADIFWKTKQ